MTRNYTLMPVFTPVTPSAARADGRVDAGGSVSPECPEASKGFSARNASAADPASEQMRIAADHSTGAPSVFFRAENEDDDGYDPYSDRPEPHPMFERDPWE